MSEVSGQFINGPSGPIFVLLRRPTTRPLGSVLVVPPFGEEMNKCRRMVTEASLGLTRCGVASLVPDLYGTGDSGGDFAVADWTGWVEDLGRVVRWSESEGCPVDALLAVRLGAALAVEAVNCGALPAVRRTVLWQPAFDGARHLAQFLRLRVAASLMDDRKETLADLRTLLQRGEIVEVSGYGVSSRLAAGLQAVSMPERLPESFGEVAWFEVVRKQGDGLAAPSSRLVDNTRAAGGLVHVNMVPGEPFWPSTEIVVNEAVIAGTVQFLDTVTNNEGCQARD